MVAEVTSFSSTLISFMIFEHDEKAINEMQTAADKIFLFIYFILLQYLSNCKWILYSFIIKIIS